MMVTTTAGKQGALPKVVVVLDPAEIDALLAGRQPSLRREGADGEASPR